MPRATAFPRQLLEPVIVVGSCIASVGASARPRLGPATITETAAVSAALAASLLAAGTVLLTLVAWGLLRRMLQHRLADPDHPRDLMRPPPSPVAATLAVIVALTLPWLLLFGVDRVTSGTTPAGYSAAQHRSIIDVTRHVSLPTVGHVPGLRVPAQWWVVFLLVTVVAIGAARSRPQTFEDRSSAVVQEPAHDSVFLPVIAARDALTGPSEVRQAIVASYAAMEAAAAAELGPRAPQMTPEEYLQRLAGAFPALAGPALTLTDVYQRARFSLTRMTRHDLHEARRALDALRNGFEQP